MDFLIQFETYKRPSLVSKSLDQKIRADLNCSTLITLPVQNKKREHFWHLCKTETYEEMCSIKPVYVVLNSI